VERGETVDAIDVYRVDEVERRRLYRGGIGAIGGDEEDADGNEVEEVVAKVGGDEEGDVVSDVEQ
jgi:hypothetical protein